MSTNIHAGGYKDSNSGMSHTVRVALNCSHYSFLGCYFNNHEDILLPGLHEGFHTFGLRWKRDLLEWFVIFAPHRYHTTTRAHEK